MRDTNAHVVMHRTRSVEAGVGASLRPQSLMQNLCHRLGLLCREGGEEARGAALTVNAPRGQVQRGAFAAWQFVRA